LWVTVIFILSAIVLWKQHRGVKFSLHWFISTKILSFGMLFTIMMLIASAYGKDYTHFSSILFVGGLVAAFFLHNKLEMLKSKEKPHGFRTLLILASLIIGTLAIFAAWELFPNISNQNDWVTFGLLVLLGLTMTLRAIPALRFHIYLPTGVATWAATVAPSWLEPFSPYFTPGPMLTNLVVIVVSATFWIILTVVLLWLSHTTDFMDKTLNSPPLLFITTLACLTWACMLVIMPWLQ
jgi:hypothetical protein